MTTRPDLSSRPLRLIVERRMVASPDVLYRAWTKAFDEWFAARGTLSMKAEIGSPFFFEAHFDGQRHPHYGRFLRLTPGQLVEMTWVTGNPGTGGAETVVRISLMPAENGTQLTLEHGGFADEAARTDHEQAWPRALDLLDHYASGDSGAAQ